MNFPKEFYDIDGNLNGALILKESLPKLGKSAILCQVNQDSPYFLKIIAYNDEFIKDFKLNKNDVLGKNYDFLFDSIDFSYSENHLQYKNLLKAVKNFKSIEVTLNVPRKKSRKLFDPYKVGFYPNGLRDRSNYAILTFDALQEFRPVAIYDPSNPNDLSPIQRLERKFRSERALRIVSQVVVSDLSLKKIADEISKMLCEYLKVSRCILYDYTNEEIGFISEHHDFYSKKMVPKSGSNSANFELIRRYIKFQNEFSDKFSNSEKKSNATFKCDDVSDDWRFDQIRDICKEFHIGAQLSIITTLNGKINGGLFIHQPNMVNWFTGDIEFLEIVAEQFSAAVDRSHSLDKVMEANQKLVEKTLQLRKSLKEEKRVRKMQTEFVAMVSHEFKTPLQIIDGTREVIARKLKTLNIDNESINNSLNRIQNGVKRLNGLVQGNLSLSEVETSGDSMGVKKEKFSLAELIEDILDKNSSLPLEKNIKVVCELSYLPDLYNGDKKLLDHCFTNVIVNAIKYSSQDSEVKISTHKLEKKLVIKVKDSGIGIPEEDIYKVGQKFFRAKNTLAVPGTGIGLYLTKYFIELHNGSILIESKLNEGTLVSVFLPLTN